MNRETVGRPFEILLLEEDLGEARQVYQELRSREIQHRLTWLSHGADAAEFLARAGKYRSAPLPDLILLNLQLTGITKVEALRLIETANHLQDVPVVVLSDEVSDAAIFQGLKIRVEAHLNKPIKSSEFGTMVSCLCRSRHAGMILTTAS